VETFIISHWEGIAFIIALVFNAGVMYKAIKEKPSEKRVGEMIDAKFDNHCPFSEKIQGLESNVIKQADYRELLAKELHQETEMTHLSLQRMELNLKRVCNKLDLGYLT
jgi:hypothetical protein